MKYGDEQNMGIALVLTYVVKYEKTNGTPSIGQTILKIQKREPEGS